MLRSHFVELCKADKLALSSLFVALLLPLSLGVVWPGKKAAA
jgi:hypothetical protein